eukprot:scaffold72341_cov43-Prasinocladus_malaysianus.AAC.1
MIYEQKCEAIVMLTKISENRRVKCAEYYPTTEETKQVHGAFEVTLVSEGTVPGFDQLELRTINITPSTGGDSWLVQHYLYLDWPDHGAPTNSDSISAGIGRTGAFCAIDIMIRRIRHWLNTGAEISDEKCDDLLDISKVITNLRYQRPGMVQTV